MLHFYTYYKYSILTFDKAIAGTFLVQQPSSRENAPIKLILRLANLKHVDHNNNNNSQIQMEGRKFAKSANAIRDQLDIIKGKMRRQDTKTDASIQELDAHMADALEMLNNLESAYQHLIAPDVGDERYRERFDEQLNQFNLVEAWIKEVKIWFKEALQEGKVPATQEQVDEWQDDYDKLELEVEKFDAEDMTRLRAH
ncbi:8038_t:CDS:2 [Entrophospora sp. SA101]|nr:8038_t:CDS:2 [Entrophospora sp. SA101]